MSKKQLKLAKKISKPIMELLLSGVDQITIDTGFDNKKVLVTMHVISGVNAEEL